MSFLTPSAPTVAHAGLGFAEVLGPLLTLATSGVGLYLEKEKQRRAGLEAKRALALAQQQAATEAAAVAYATQQQQAAMSQSQLQSIIGGDVLQQAQQALSTPTATYALIGALVVGGALLLRR